MRKSIARAVYRVNTLYGKYAALYNRVVGLFNRGVEADDIDVTYLCYLFNNLQRSREQKAYGTYGCPGGSAII